MKAVLGVLLLCLSTSVSLHRTYGRINPPAMGLGGNLWSGGRPGVIGLVGGIASGKSTVTRVLEERCGLAGIDADKLGHESYEPGTRCFKKLVAEFGSHIVAEDGTIDRRALGDAVFGKPANMERLQGIVWPEIRLLAERRIADLGREGAEFAVLEAAVLLDAGWDDMCAELWSVQVSPAVARTRLMKRNNLNEEQADKRLASQPMTNEERAARSAVVIANNATEEELIKEVQRVWNTRASILRRSRRRKKMVLQGAAAAAGAAVIAAASIVLKRGRTMR